MVCEWIYFNHFLLFWIIWYISRTGNAFYWSIRGNEIEQQADVGFPRKSILFPWYMAELSIPTRCRRSAERTLVRWGQRLFSGLICKIIYSVCQWNFYLFQGEVKPWSRRTKITHGVFLRDLLYSTSKGSCNKPFGSYVNYLRRLLRFNHIYFVQQKHNAKYL